MPYIAERVVHDADSHVFEPPGWLEPHVDPDMRDKLERFLRADERVIKRVEQARASYNDPEFRARDEEEVLLRKGFSALGAFVSEERPAALDYLGVASQLAFTTAGLGPLAAGERDDDPDVAYGVARAHNRAMAEFCSVDRRLLPVLYLPLVDLDRAPAFAGEAIEMGAAALMVAARCPKNHSPSHVGLDSVWARAEEAGIPVVFHVGGGTPMNPTYKENGLPPVKDFTGGDGNFTSLTFMAIPDAPMHTLSALIIDGVLDRHPNLKLGVIEQGASWLPGWMRALDSAAEAFYKNEERLHKLSLKPSEFVRRQVRVTPYPHEPVGWVIKNSGPEICLFSSDYPHTEGGRNPIKRFEAHLDAQNCTDTERDAFYRANFEDLMGSALANIPVPA